MNSINHLAHPFPIRPLATSGLLGRSLAFFLLISVPSGTTLAASIVTTSGSSGAASQLLSDNETVGSGSASGSVAGGFSGAGYSQSFFANAFANGDSGRIGVAAGNILTGTAPNPSSRATGIIEDEIIVIGPPGNVTVEFMISMIGRFDNTGGPSGHTADIILRLNNGTNHRAVASWVPNTPTSPVFYGTTGSSSDVIITVPTGIQRTPQNVNASIRILASVPTGVAFPVKATLGVISSPAPNSTTNAFFDQTAYLTMRLPEGVTYTSQSGTFLTIPEPRVALLAMLGALGIIGRRFRRVS